MTDQTSNFEFDKINKRIDELFANIDNLASDSSIDNSDISDLNERGLFVVGHARSGTSILMNLLNYSTDICCLSEPYLYRSFYYKPFPKMFNEMNDGQNNLPIKGHYVPDYGMVNGRTTLTKLAQDYRYVGEKLAFRQKVHDYDVEAFFEFAMKNFASSTFVCLIRDPTDVTSSAIKMFENSDFSDENIRDICKSQLECYALILRMISMFRNVILLSHGKMNNQTLINIGKFLKTDLSAGFNVYNHELRVTAKTEIKDNDCLNYTHEKFLQLEQLIEINGDRFTEENKHLAMHLLRNLYYELKNWDSES